MADIPQITRKTKEYQQQLPRIYAHTIRESRGKYTNGDRGNWWDRGSGAMRGPEKEMARNPDRDSGP
jgi:hypothetical protein